MSGIEKGMTQAERLAVIKAAAEKFNAKIKRNAKVRRTETPVMDRSYDDNMNINQWTDASKYAKEYYGEVAYETTRFDNDWD
jgi:hypothetical protein